MQGRVTVVELSVCLSVCVCVDTYSSTKGYEAALLVVP